MNLSPILWSSLSNHSSQGGCFNGLNILSFISRSPASFNHILFFAKLMFITVGGGRVFQSDLVFSVCRMSNQIVSHANI